jgi:hypothetical protein
MAGPGCPKPAKLRHGWRYECPFAPNRPLRKNIVIRSATLADAAEIARLSAQLGYPAEVPVFADRLRRLATTAGGRASSAWNTG